MPDEPADIVEAVARAIAKDAHNRGAEYIRDSGGLMVDWDQLSAADHANLTQDAIPDARAAIAAARPMIEKEAFEKAARVAEEHADQCEDTTIGKRTNGTARDIAAAIRALIEPRP